MSSGKKRGDARGRFLFKQDEKARKTLRSSGPGLYESLCGDLRVSIGPGGLTNSGARAVTVHSMRAVEASYVGLRFEPVVEMLRPGATLPGSSWIVSCGHGNKFGVPPMRARAKTSRNERAVAR